ncbi:MAG: hypothetical protein HC933_08915 [Pleurocapsa sp. SU_196_0]|nr:hypothetical protein [Pleurocapsa sp. SU_196_0]
MNLTVWTSRIVAPFSLLIALNACSLTGSNTFTGTAKGYELSSQDGSASSGTLKRALLSDGSTATTLSLTGLTPDVRYTAQYRARGNDNAPACESQSEVTASFGTFTADALGNARVGLLSQTSSLSGEASAAVDVRRAEQPERAILCADLLETEGTVLNDLTGAGREEPFGVRVGSTARGMARVVALSDGMTAATISLSGLQPNTVYNAQFRALGTASDLPCLSRGVATAQFSAFSSDESGNGWSRLLTPSVRITANSGRTSSSPPRVSAVRCARICRVYLPWPCKEERGRLDHH